MKASVARTIKAILGKLLRFFGLRHLKRERAAFVHEPPRLDVAQVATGQDGGEFRDDLPGRHQARIALLQVVPPPREPWGELRGRRRRKRGLLRGKDRCRSLADLPTGRPGDTHNGLRFAAVPPSGA